MAVQGGLHLGSPGLPLSCECVGSAAQATSAPPAARGSPSCPRAPIPPAGRARGCGKTSRSSRRGLRRGWREAARPGPSPELGVVDQGAQGSGEGGHVALQPRRAGSGHGLPRGARRRKAVQAGGTRLEDGGRESGGCREAGQPGEAAGRKPARCVVRHGPLLGKPGRQRWAGRPGEQWEGAMGQRGVKHNLAAEAAPSGTHRMGKQGCVLLRVEFLAVFHGLALAPLARGYGPQAGGFAAEQRDRGEERQAAGILENAAHPWRSPSPPPAQSAWKAAGHSWVPSSSTGTDWSPAGRFVP